MDCRTARALVRESHLSPPNKQQLVEHLAHCGACADDQTDPVGRLLRDAELPLAHPPPSFVDGVIHHLPSASPDILHRRSQLVRRIGNVLIGVVMLMLTFLILRNFGAIYAPSTKYLAAVGGLHTPTAQLLLRPLLVAKAILIPASHLVSLLLLGLALMVVGLLTRAKVPASTPALATCSLALLLLSAGVQQVQHVSTSTRSSFAAPIEVRTPVTGDVVSTLGDVVVHAPITGDVIALAGTVTLAADAKVGGSVLSGGPVVTTGTQIGGGTVDGLGSWSGLAQAIATPGATVSSSVTRLATLVITVLAFVIALLWAMLNDEPVKRASHALSQRPGPAMLWGVLLLFALTGLAFAGAVLLAATVAGVILLPILVLALHLPVIHGLAAIGEALGHHLDRRNSPEHLLLGISLQSIAILGLLFVSPLLALLQFYLLAAWGMGAALLERQNVLLGD